MTYPYPVFPDEVKVITDFLDGNTYLTEYAPVIISGNLVGYVFPERRITVSSVTGSIVNPVRLAAPIVDINVYAEDKYTAKNLCLAATAALRSMRGLTTNEAVIAKVETSTPSDLTDPINNSPRFVASATIYIRPN